MVTVLFNRHSTFPLLATHISISNCFRWRCGNPREHFNKNWICQERKERKSYDNFLMMSKAGIPNSFAFNINTNVHTHIQWVCTWNQFEILYMKCVIDCYYFHDLFCAEFSSNDLWEAFEMKNQPSPWKWFLFFELNTSYYSRAMLPLWQQRTFPIIYLGGFTLLLFFFLFSKKDIEGQNKTKGTKKNTTWKQLKANGSGTRPH